MSKHILFTCLNIKSYYSIFNLYFTEQILERQDCFDPSIKIQELKHKCLIWECCNESMLVEEGLIKLNKKDINHLHF